MTLKNAFQCPFSGQFDWVRIRWMTAAIFEPNLKQALLARTVDTGQVHTWDSQRMVVNYVSLVLTKVKPTRL